MADTMRVKWPDGSCKDVEPRGLSRRQVEYVLKTQSRPEFGRWAVDDSLDPVILRRGVNPKWRGSIRFCWVEQAGGQSGPTHEEFVNTKGEVLHEHVSGYLSY